MRFNIMSLFLVLGFLGISANSNSQDQKLSRQEKKEVRKSQMIQNFYALDTLLNARNFVLEADFLQNKYGVMIPVTSNLNFIKVNQTEGILQTGSDMSIGYNGVGGVTAEGNITSYKVFKDTKRLRYMIQFSLLTDIGHYDISMTVTSDNHASATITGLWPGRLTWDGHLETIYNSRVFKGQRTI